MLQLKLLHYLELELLGYLLLLLVLLEPVLVLDLLLLVLDLLSVYQVVQHFLDTYILDLETKILALIR